MTVANKEVRARKATKSNDTDEMTIRLKPIEFQYLHISVVGTSPLLLNSPIGHLPDELEKERIQDPSARKDKKKSRTALDPKAKFLDCADYGQISQGVIPYDAERLGIGLKPFSAKSIYCGRSSWFKEGAVAMSRFYEATDMTRTKLAMRMEGDLLAVLDVKGNPIHIDYEKNCRRDIAWVGNFGAKKPDLRYRPCLPEWRFDLTVRHAPSIIAAESIVALLAHMGEMNGVGDWRPEKGSGTFGCFKLLPVKKQTVL